MTTAASDYEAAVKALRTQTLPAFVAYTEAESAHGIVHWGRKTVRVVVDVKNKRVISQTPTSDDGGIHDADAATKRIFDPACYSATGEKRERWNDMDVIAISVTRSPACKGGDEFQTVYADATTLDLVGADENDNDEDISVDISVRYARFGQYVMPASVSAHVRGHGWLFFARERGEMTFSDYSFDQTRRQAQSTKP